MRNFLLFSFVLATVFVQAQNRQNITSVSNGNASNPFIWDCLCFPSPSDNVTINHAVTLDVDWATSGNFTINAGKSLTGNTANRILAVNGGNFTNNGTFTIAFLYHSGGVLNNNSVINVTQSMGVAAGFTTTNNNSLVVTDSLYIGGTITNNNTLSAYGTAVSGTLTNNGSFTTGDLWNSGLVTNAGLPGLIITDDIYSSGTINNTTHISVANDFWNSENVNNYDYIDIDHTLYTGDSVQLTANFTNNGLVSIAFDLYCNQTVTGTGDFCVAGTTANSGDISGTLDICDLSGGNIDANFGTIAPTVTFCQSSCAIGIEEEKEKQEISVYPNPFENRLTVNSIGYENATFVLQNILGQKMISQTINGKTEIPVSDFDSGVYFYSVISEGKVVSSGKLLKE